MDNKIDSALQREEPSGYSSGQVNKQLLKFTTQEFTNEA